MRVAALFAFAVLAGACSASAGAEIINIVQPENGATVTTGFINVVGRASGETVLSALNINGVAHGVPDAPGVSFNVQVGLKRGLNTLTIAAVSADGEEQTVELSVVRDDTPPKAEFTVRPAATDIGEAGVSVEIVLTEEITSLSTIYFNGSFVEIPAGSRVFLLTREASQEEGTAQLTVSDTAGNEAAWRVDLKTGRATAGRVAKMLPAPEEGAYMPPIMEPDAALEDLGFGRHKHIPEKEIGGGDAEPPRRDVPESVTLEVNDKRFESVAALRAEEGRTYISMAALAGIMPSAKVERGADGEATLVLARGGARKADRIAVKAGADGFTLNGREVTLEKAITDAGGELLLPVRRVFESLGYEVVWENESKRVVLSGGPPPPKEGVKAASAGAWGVDDAKKSDKDDGEIWPPIELGETTANRVAEKKSVGPKGFLDRLNSYFVVSDNSSIYFAIVLLTIILMAMLSAKIIPYVIRNHKSRDSMRKEVERERARRLRERNKYLAREVFTADELSVMKESELTALFERLTEKAGAGKMSRDEIFPYFHRIIVDVVREDAYSNSKVEVAAVEDRSFKGITAARFTVNAVTRKRMVHSEDYLWFTSGGKFVARQKIVDGKQVSVEYPEGVKPWDHAHKA